MFIGHAGILAAQVALVPKKIELTTSNGYLDGCQAFGNGDSTSMFMAGCFEIPSGGAVTSTTYILLFYNGGTLGQFETVYSATPELNFLRFGVRGNSGYMKVGDIPVDWSGAGDKYYWMFRHKSIVGGSTCVSLYKKNTAAAVTMEGTPTFGSNYNRVDSNQRIGANHAGTGKCRMNVGPLWGGQGLTYDASSANVFEDFFGVGSASDGNSAVPQYVTATGAFTGPNTSTSYAQPMGVLHWNSVGGGDPLANVGSRGGTFAVTGDAIPISNW